MKNNNSGFAATAALWVALAILAVVAGAYLILNSKVSGEMEEATGAEERTEVSKETTAMIDWRFTDAGEEDNIPYTDVLVTIDDIPYTIGKFQGSCSVVGPEGGVDGRGLLAGELSAAQCWFAGGGDEIGIFANEDGGIDIMVGGLSEGSAEEAGFRGDFEIRQTIEF